MKTSDEELAQQIKTVFDDYNDGLSEHGWSELRQKYPEKENKKLPIWLLSGIAATLLIVAGVYLNNVFDTEKVILRANTAPKENPIKENDIVENKSESFLPSDTENTISKNNSAVAKTHSNNRLNNSFAPEKQHLAQNITVTNKKVEKEVNIIANENSTSVKSITATENNNQIIASARVDEHNIAENVTTDKTVEVVEKDAKPTKLSTTDFLNEQSKILANNNTDKETKQNNRSQTTIDVFTGTFFNYHDDNEAKLSAGVGLNANVKVAKNIVLSFGAGISQNKVSYENKVPVEVASAMFESKNTALNAAPSNGVAYSATATNDVSFTGQLLSIDLPMVVKFYPTNKQDFYISTGINSSSYLTQKYTYNYNWSNFNVKNGEEQPQQQVEKSRLKGFDFANSAIFAIGINQNIGKNVLIFEPYYKPALSTMGDKNLKISSAGLNLKFNFNGNSKK